MGGVPAPVFAILGPVALSVGAVAAAVVLKRAGCSWGPVVLLGISSFGITIFKTHAWPGGPLTFGGVAIANAWLVGPEQSRNNKLNLYQDQVCSGLEKRGPSKSGSTKEEPAYVRFDCSQVLGQKFRISRTQGKRPRVSCCQSATQPTTEQQGDGTPPSIFRAPLRLSFCCQSFTTEMNLRSKKMQLFRFVEQTYTSQN